MFCLRAPPPPSPSPHTACADRRVAVDDVGHFHFISVIVDSSFRHFDPFIKI